MENLMSTTFEDGSSISLRYREEEGFHIFHTDDAKVETKLVGMHDEIDYDLAKDIYLLLLKSYAEYEEEEEDDEDDEEDDDGKK